MKRFLVTITFLMVSQTIFTMDMDEQAFSAANEDTLFDFSDEKLTNNEFIIDPQEDALHTSAISECHESNGYIINNFEDLNDNNLSTSGMISEGNSAPISQAALINPNQTTVSDNTALLNYNNVSCPDCPGLFPTARSLALHIKSVHTDKNNLDKTSNITQNNDTSSMFQIVSIADPKKKRGSGYRYKCLYANKNGTQCQYLALGYNKFKLHSKKHSK